MRNWGPLKLSANGRDRGAVVLQSSVRAAARLIARLNNHQHPGDKTGAFVKASPEGMDPKAWKRHDKSSQRSPALFNTRSLGCPLSLLLENTSLFSLCSEQIWF